MRISDWSQTCALPISAQPEALDMRAKRGFCLAMMGRDEEAETLLTVGNAGEHPLARSILAWMLAGPYGQRLRGGCGTKEQVETRAQRGATVESLLQGATAAELPPAWVFQAAFGVLGTYGKNAAGLADRARTLYPGWGRAHAINAAHQRVNGTLDPSVLEPLMRTLSTTQHDDAYEEGYTHALMLGRFDDAERVVSALLALYCADPQQAARNVSLLEEMRLSEERRVGKEGERTGKARWG